ncbi:MAG: bifunctional rhamnulose-1-phosphate aldolase/short-chain dehydrogenase [Bacteroidetes bacterium]|nr:bifunctional rhamnulose-1-phosphate aldolase/short-chain dehydrogenase [Bacteroidota bacterium]MCH8231775.1 bifunctional rhamnulose-1-phosphate aldolase/short-chain dehydrogenase [Bacteroidota bacterium]
MDEIKPFKHVNYLWDESKAAGLDDNEVALFLYRSNILGADLRITNFGGGNTSCKTTEKHPLTGEDTEVMWVKGSGGDLGTLTRKGIAGLYVERMRSLKNRYRGLEFEDEMVQLLYHCIYDPESKAPSIDTPLHGFLPFKHIDHLHPDALIAIAASKDGEAITKELWGDAMGWLPWQRPGFDLGLKMAQYITENPDSRGIVLGGHGLFTWGDTSYDCYINSLEVIETASQYILSYIEKTKVVFGGTDLRLKRLDKKARRKQASAIAPLIRGLCSGEVMMVGHYTDAATALEFISSNDLQKLAKLGTSCPDHFLRTKIQPLVLDFASDADIGDYKKVKSKLAPQFEAYQMAYKKYYVSCRHHDSPPMRNPSPVVILYPGVGMFTFAKNKKTARLASEFYINAINVMRGAEAISEYIAMSRQEAFNIEYWALEEAKLKRMPPEKPLTGRVAFITGAGGGIGKAIAGKLVEEGACVILSDISEERLKEAIPDFNKDNSTYVVCDVTDPEAVADALDKAMLYFGGVDILIHSAGLAISKSIADTSLEDWDLLMNVLSKGQFLLAQKGVEIMRKQGFGGDIVNIVSKNALVAGPKNVGYGTAKAAQMHMSRLMAAELGPDRIRVNVINPDGVIVGSKIWEGEWAEERAKAYDISVDELPAYYAKRNLLQAIIYPEDIASGVFAVLSELKKSTGNIINVDGGIPAAFAR